MSMTGLNFRASFHILWLFISHHQPHGFPWNSLPCEFQTFAAFLYAGLPRHAVLTCSSSLRMARVHIWWHLRSWPDSGPEAGETEAVQCLLPQVFPSHPHAERSQPQVFQLQGPGSFQEPRLPPPTKRRTPGPCVLWAIIHVMKWDRSLAYESRGTLKQPPFQYPKHLAWLLCRFIKCSNAQTICSSIIPHG